MNRRAVCFLLSFFLVLVSVEAQRFTLVIDPGHGGKDGGTVRGQYQEKKIVLAVANAFGKLIEDNMSDVNVLYTRKTDVFIPLDRRASLANKNKANLFISIHVNSTGAQATSVSGVETYALGFSKSAANLEVAKRENEVVKFEDNYKQKYEGFDPDSPESYIIFEFMSTEFLNQSLEFARSVQRNVKTIAKRNDRGARQDNFLVLREAGMPAVLVELGFINNTSDATYLTSAAGQKKLAESLYSAFREYKLKYDSRLGTVAVASPVKQDATPVTKDPTPVVKDPTPVIKSPTPVANQAAAKSDANKITNASRSSAKTSEKPASQSVGQKNETIKKDVIEYRVQFYYSKQKLPANSPKLKGIANVSFYQDGAGYKYTGGSTTNFNEAIKIQRQIRQKYKDAFVVRFKNGVRQ